MTPEPLWRTILASIVRREVVILAEGAGGRQLDGVAASLDALPEVVEAVGDRAEVLMDGGIRRGTRRA